MTGIAVVVGLIVLILLIVGATFLAGKSAGKTSAIEKIEHDTIKVKDKQQQAAADAPKTKEDIINRAKSKGGI